MPDSKPRRIPRARKLMHRIMDDVYELFLTPDRDLQVAFDLATWERIADQFGEELPRLQRLLEQAKSIRQAQQRRSDS